MNRAISGWAAGILMAVLALIAPGCETKVTPENFDQVAVGMTLEQVQNILGAGKDETAAGTSISGAGIASGGSGEKTYVWREGGLTLTVVFGKDGKVVQKTKTGG